MASSKNDSNISKPGDDQPPGPVKQHHRLALGEKVSGTSNPNGASPDTKNLIAGQKKNW